MKSKRAQVKSSPKPKNVKTKVSKVTVSKSKKEAEPKKPVVAKKVNNLLKSRLVKDLLTEKAFLEERLTSISFSPSATSGDTADMSIALSEEKMKVLEQDRLRKKLDAVKIVLNRIETNPNFAKCDDCGDEIELKRLLFMPTARRCVFCQENSESR